MESQWQMQLNPNGQQQIENSCQSIAQELKQSEINHNSQIFKCSNCWNNSSNKSQNSQDKSFTINKVSYQSLKKKNQGQLTYCSSVQKSLIRIEVFDMNKQEYYSQNEYQQQFNKLPSEINFSQPSSKCCVCSDDILQIGNPCIEQQYEQYQLNNSQKSLDKKSNKTNGYNEQNSVDSQRSFQIVQNQDTYSQVKLQNQQSGVISQQSQGIQNSQYKDILDYVLMKSQNEQTPQYQFLEIYYQNSGAFGLDRLDSIKQDKKQNVLIIKLNLSKAGHQEIGKTIQNFLEGYNLLHLTLTLSSSQISCDGVQNILEPIQKMQNLTKLKLDFSNNQIKVINFDFPHLDNLKKININLRENQVNDEGIQSIIKSLANLQNIIKLNLNLSSNKIKDQAIQGFLVINLSKIQKFILDISNNRIQSKGVQYVTKFIEKLQSIKNISLDISSNQLIGHDAVQQIFSSLGNCSQIRHINLNFENNKILDHEATKEILKYLKKCENVTQIILTLSNTGIRNEDLKEIADELASLKNISQLLVDIKNIELDVKDKNIIQNLETKFKEKIIFEHSDDPKFQQENNSPIKMNHQNQSKIIIRSK